ncbi:MAG: PEP-utilizing enzyme, partial [Chloroflexi bacterium]|nr:PEP-utilizing enzyme [Chloroflexota bacterium]
LEALAMAVRALPAAADLLRDLPPEQAAARLAAAAAPALAALWRSMEEVRRRYASREVGGMSLANPSWGEDPAYLVAAVASLAQSDDDGSARSASLAARADRARRRVLAGLEYRGLGILRGVFGYLLKKVRSGYRLREDSHFVLLGFMPPLRRGALTLGRRWAGRGLLDRPEDVLYLTLNDLREVAAGRREARPVMEDRRRRWRAARRGWSALLPPSGATTETPPGALMGTAASRGVVTAPARLIRDQREFHRLRPGEVLVCAATSPSWTPLFALASAVVTESGGMMSHAAIVAREYGIPAVMGAGGALSRLRDGEMVTVDGGHGWVLPAGAAEKFPPGGKN